MRCLKNLVHTTIFILPRNVIAFQCFIFVNTFCLDFQGEKKKRFVNKEQNADNIFLKDEK